MANHFHPGQRWVSESEPELGLGAVTRVGPRTVTVAFAASGETREYAQDPSPLRRVRFHVGETLLSRTGQSLRVTEVEQRQELLFYRGAGTELCETDLSATLQFHSPRQRLLAGLFDPGASFSLRVQALEHQHQRRQARVRGFLGGRIDLIPHQLAIAAQVAERQLPRVLLADEVGLGKTIEACLILHRLQATGRAQRVLILVPDSLVHQWFLELVRRFSLWFHIFDEERCAALEAEGASNPFLDDQLVLASLSLFSGQAGAETRLEQALAAGWDLLVVDEAHHLRWSPAEVSPEYAVVERLSAAIPSLLLLTATPEQLGVASHFARLRLLDPARFYDLQAYIDQAETFRDVARLADVIQAGTALPDPELAQLADRLGEPVAGLRQRLAGADPAAARAGVLAALLDQHGTGRVMFRNTRARISGFPARVAHLHPLEVLAEDRGRRAALAKEFLGDLEPAATKPSHASLLQDPRTLWLVQLLHSTGDDKLLLLCRTRAKAEALEAALRHHLKLKVGLFHEGLTLVQRDRGAAWFASPDGARLLICSEIGSEGRNFQFAHRLVLFDLPLDPALLEQRIGRLDRIGQRAEIQIHVPFLTGTGQELLARWYHEGLDAFQRNLAGGRELLEQFRPRLLALAQCPDPAGLETLLADTRQASAELAIRLEQGRDRLLELTALGQAGAAGAADLVAAIQAEDQDRALDDFMLATFDHCFVPVEEVAPRTYQLGSVGVLAESFPGLPAEGLTVTCDRQRALVREDLQFLTWDHPLVSGALDLLLGSQQGTCCFAHWPDPKVSGLYLEAVFLLECLAPPALHVDRFLPPSPLRVVVDHGPRDVSAVLTPATLVRLLEPPGGPTMALRLDWVSRRLPAMLDLAETQASAQVSARVGAARQAMAAQLGAEVARLRALARVNGGVRPEEVRALEAQRIDLDRHLGGARVRLDALRLIYRGRR